MRGSSDIGDCMAKFLFVVPPLTGHINPTVSVAQRLEEGGHQVAWVGYVGKVKPLLPEGARLIPVVDPADGEFVVSSSQPLLWDHFIKPLTHAMMPGVEAAVKSYQPDLMVVDQQTLAGAFFARKHNLRWATLATSGLDAMDPSEPGATMLWQYANQQFEELQQAFNMEPIERPDNSPELVVVFSTRDIFGARDFPASYQFVGPSISARPETCAFPWDELHNVPRVLVSFGTVNSQRGERFFRTVADALADAPLQVVLVAPDGMLPEPPSNFLVRDYVPQLELLSHVDAVLCHAGHNTAAEALAHGVPLVMTPIRDDQPIVARAVVRAGAGLRLRFSKRLKPTDIRQAVDRVLGEPQFAEAANRIRESFAKAGGAQRAAHLVEHLAIR